MDKGKLRPCHAVRLASRVGYPRMGHHSSRYVRLFPPSNPSNNPNPLPFRHTNSFRGSFLTAIFLAHFIRMRYISSGYTRQAVSSATQYVDRALVGKPPALVNAWATGKTVVGNWMGMTMPAQGQPGPAAGAAAAAGGAAPAAGRR